MTNPANRWKADAKSIHIGVINNMPDAALEATERQFRGLLSEAAGDIEVQVSLFAIPQIPRSERARSRIDALYSSINELWGSQLDGLIVTGAEPLAPKLPQEAFWPTMQHLVDWAERNTYSTIWSCLAAQAAVLQLDGIERRPIGSKLFGVFECSPAADHFLTTGVQSRFWTPHSRWNDIPREALSSNGYRVLSTLSTGTVDAFAKQRKTLFVFFQGHPEYDMDTLLLEYRRDIRRFLNGTRDSYPSMPLGYFEEEATAVLGALKERALASRNAQQLVNFPITTQNSCAKYSWRPEAVRLYRNWLLFLSERKCEGLGSRQIPMKYNLGTAASAVVGTGCLAQEADAG